MKHKKFRLSNTKIIALSFLGVILVGAILLCLPIASAKREWTHPLDALFMSTSATCITGLVLFDTYTYWSLFGKIVLLVQIQIGGLGFMTLLTVFALVTNKNLSLHKRQLLMQSAGNIQLNGAMSLVRKVLIGTLIFEGLGTVLLSFRFCPMMGFGEGLFNAFFHAVSAFCNAGYDLMGRFEPFSSLTHFRDDLYVQAVIMGLIIVGGIGFFVWSDILKCGKRIWKYTLYTKMVLISSTFLLLFGWVAFFILEKDGALAEYPLNEQILGALFQSVTTRTAGFNTIDQTELTGGGVLSIVWMMIGGSPGSTAGGIKNVTVFICILSAISTVCGKESCIVFKKKVSEETVRQAFAITTIYITLLIVSTILIMSLESVELEKALFEATAAISTVGLSMGITQSVGTATKIILMLLMFIGRVGGLSFVLVFATEKAKPDIQRPTEKVMIG